MLTDDKALDNIAHNVRHFRAERSLCWLAKEVGTYPINISRIEDKVSMPGAGLLGRIAEVLDVSVDQLLATPPKKFSKTG